MMLKRLRLTLILLLLGAGGNESAWAQPVAPSVVNGQVTFNRPSGLQITNSPGAILNWQAFSIGTPGFIQQSAAASALNSVVGAGSGVIVGNLQSNGRVLLLDPNGAALKSGPGSPVAIAGAADTSTGKPTTVFLEAPAGSITEVKGASMLAPGKSMVLTDAKNPDMKIEITAPQNRALDVGQLLGAIGSKGIASALTARDTPGATRAVLGENGAIMLKSAQ